MDGIRGKSDVIHQNREKTPCLRSYGEKLHVTAFVPNHKPARHQGTETSRFFQCTDLGKKLKTQNGFKVCVSPATDLLPLFLAPLLSLSLFFLSLSLSPLLLEKFRFLGYCYCGVRLIPGQQLILLTPSL